MPIRIVVLDGYALNPGDLTWAPIANLGELTVHDRTPADQIVERTRGAAAVLTNKTPMRASVLAELPELRYIGVLATGYDVIDASEANRRGIVVTNIPTYGTHSVAQFAIALLLELCHHAGRHSEDTRAGGWSRNPDWSYHLEPLIELAGKTIGIVGYGRIGRQVAGIASALGMRVIACDPLAARSRAGRSRYAARPSRCGHAACAADPGESRADRRGCDREDEARRFPDQHRPGAAGQRGGPRRGVAWRKARGRRARRPGKRAARGQPAASRPELPGHAPHRLGHHGSARTPDADCGRTISRRSSPASLATWWHSELPIMTTVAPCPTPSSSIVKQKRTI